MPNDHQGVSLSWLEVEFGLSRATIRKRIQDAGISPSGKYKTYDIYRVAEVAPLICKVEVQNWEQVNPDSLEPMLQNQYWNAQKAKVQTDRERDRLLADRRLLLENDQVEYGIAKLLRGLREGIMPLADIIETEAGLSVKQRAIVDQQIDLLLANLSDGVQRMFTDNDDDDDLPAD